LTTGNLSQSKGFPAFANEHKNTQTLLNIYSVSLYIQQACI